LRSKRQANRAAGFTLIELVIVIAIIAILAAMVGSSMARSKPRANLASAATELQALIHQARQSALATGNPVGVLVYKSYSPTADPTSIGYVIVYQDACFDFFTNGATCGVSYGGYNPAVLRTGGKSTVLDTMTLPSGIIVGPPTGMGASASLKAPLQGVLVNVACDFCDVTGGAIQFDPRGQASFYKLNGTTVAPYTPIGGASISLGFNPAVTDATGQRTLVILSGSGAVELISGG
jgi:prepilin-type N-terminal cleavage/methylation domain-containing protein